MLTLTTFWLSDRTEVRYPKIKIKAIEVRKDLEIFLGVGRAEFDVDKSSFIWQQPRLVPTYVTKGVDVSPRRPSRKFEACPTHRTLYKVSTTALSMSHLLTPSLNCERPSVEQCKCKK